MPAGKRDRLIEIQQSTSTKDDSGEPLFSWSTVASAWAEKVEKGGSERLAAQQLSGKTVMTFRFLWNDDTSVVTSKHRISYGGRYFEITDVREVGYHKEIEVDCVVPSEQPMGT